MTKHLVCVVLLSLFFEINFGHNIYEEAGKYIDKYERGPEKEYYKKERYDARVNLEKNPENFIDIDDWKAKYYEKTDELKQYKNKYEKYYNSDSEYKKNYDGDYKFKNSKSEYKKNYDGDYKYKKEKYEEVHPMKYENEENYQRTKRDCGESGYKHKHRKGMKNPYATIDPPDHTKYIAMARYVVHQGDWASVATISVIDAVKGFPFPNIVSMSDGPIEESSGIPYFYLTPLDYTHKDYTADNRCTVTVSLAETGYCADKKWEADDPRCSRVMLSGKILQVANGTKEFAYAQNALFTRHPSMATLPTDHGFYVAKLKIANIVMLDWFGGPQTINVRDYLNFQPTTRHFIMDDSQTSDSIEAKETGRDIVSS